MTDDNVFYYGLDASIFHNKNYFIQHEVIIIIITIVEVALITDSLIGSGVLIINENWPDESVGSAWTSAPPQMQIHENNRKEADTEADVGLVYTAIFFN